MCFRKLSKAGKIELMTKKFFIKLGSGIKLEMMVEREEREGKWPTVLLVPGFHSDLHEWGYFDQISRGLVKVGFQVFRFSFSGSGKSGGKVYDITLSRQINELNDVLNWVRSEKEVDKQRLGLLAQSFGVATTIAALPLLVKSVVFTSGAYNPRRSLEDLFKDLGGVFNEKGDSYFEADYDSVRVGLQLWGDLEKYDLEKLIKRKTQSLLMLHGKKDYVPWQSAKRVFEAAGEPKQIELPEKANHGFEPPYRKWLVKKVVEWFKETLV